MYKFKSKRISSKDLFNICFLRPGLEVVVTNDSSFKSYYRVIIQGFLDKQEGRELQRYKNMIDMNQELTFGSVVRTMSVQEQNGAFWLIDSVSNVRWYGFEWHNMLYYGSFILADELIITEQEYKTMILLGAHYSYEKIIENT